MVSQSVRQSEELQTNSVSIAACDSPDLVVCFGSGRKLWTHTSNTSLWHLVSKEGSVSIGLVEKTSGKVYEIVIE